MGSRSVCILVLAAVGLVRGERSITIDYPLPGSIFPPEILAPTFLWRDDAGKAPWQIEVTFADGAAPVHITSQGRPPPLGEIDPRAVAKTNQPPAPASIEIGAHSWQPDAAVWSAMKQHSPATVTIRNSAVSGRITISTSKDPVGAPIFYRDVPLMPSAAENGVIKPLPSTAVPLVGWRLRDISQPKGRLLLEGLPTCANCHSFSRDGKTIGIDVDGAENDKGTYAIAKIAPQMSIAKEDVITWNAFPDKPAGHRTIGFMSQISPDGRYAVSTVNEALYVANFTDYRFLQVFYPTRGILAIYDRESKRMQALPGADDPRYVHTNAVWSPDGSYLIFARATARDPYEEGRKLAAFSNDPNEIPMQYDLYRIPFNHGKGGTPEPVPGASRNGMSNSFPKVSPDGRWIVFVEARNGQLMRPDSQLYIVPAAGGEARRLRSNTPLMNSWHSFSPNGRWLVFSSKSRGPYTKMFLTHLDENGDASPAVLIENSTAANRAVNIPEFVNIALDGLQHIEVPAAEFYRLFDHALELSEKGQPDAAISEWNKALVIDPEDPKAHSNLGVALARQGRLEEAVGHFRKAVELRPEFAQGHYNLGGVLARTGRTEEAMASFRSAVRLAPNFAEARYELGKLCYLRGNPREALAHWMTALEKAPENLDILETTVWVLAVNPDAAIRDGGKAIELAERALRIARDSSPALLDIAAAAYAEGGRYPEAAQLARRALALQPAAEGLKARAALYEKGTPYRDRRLP